MSVDMAVKVLDESINKIVLIKLKGNKTIRGNLLGFDQHMNLLLDQSEEIPSDGDSKSLGSIVVRGDNPHIRCRRCGKNSFHKRHHTCASCGFPDSKIRKYSWIKWYT